jgi:hypothetical protein
VDLALASIGLDVTTHTVVGGLMQELLQIYLEDVLAQSYAADPFAAALRDGIEKRSVVEAFRAAASAAGLPDDVISAGELALKSRSVAS